MKMSFKPGTMIYPLPAVMVSCGDSPENFNIMTRRGKYRYFRQLYCQTAFTPRRKRRHYHHRHNDRTACRCHYFSLLFLFRGQSRFRNIAKSRSTAGNLGSGL